MLKLCYISANVIASFNVLVREDETKQYLFHYDEVFKSYYYVAAGNGIFDHTSIHRPIEHDVDAAWFNSESQSAFVFDGNQWTSYRTVYYANFSKGKVVLSKYDHSLLSDFGITDDYIDAVVTIKNKGYFFVNGWFYEFNETEWKKLANNQLRIVSPREKKLALTSFFDIQNDCYKNNDKEFAIVKEMWNKATASPTTSITSTMRTKSTGLSTSKTTVNGTNGYTLLFSMLIALILIFTGIAGVYIGFTLHRRKSIESVKSIKSENREFETGTFSTFKTANSNESLDPMDKSQLNMSPRAKQALTT
ncbi:hypothetical protein B4U80_11727 [Leptotrombidium deliense]|uniref:Uncharacterized protein n=1 Tax=Leptotrombidium deliense TaxID=299467 RepID=A0A443S369_9ACAR|nr:hypothetical protein B4U80_11727 [Leptotrombidium deliense]